LLALRFAGRRACFFSGAREEHQSLPLLILADDAPDDLATGHYGRVRFVAGKDEISNVLSRRHGFPEPHP
jgi:hypothetical protein